MPRQSSASTSAPQDARTRILDAALPVFLKQGFAATTVDELCRSAGVAKGGFFHHFESKEAAALAAIEHRNTQKDAQFAEAPYWRLSDPRARLLGYLDFRAELVRGELSEFTCLLGMLAQETFASHRQLQAACGAGIEGHAQTLIPTIEAARAKYAPAADWTAESLAHHLLTVVQGSFVLAKAMDDPKVARDAIAHLRRYVEHLIPNTRQRRRSR